MSKKINANVKETEVIETAAENAADVDETETVSLGTKIVTGVKKHGKKILTGIGIIVALGVGYVLGGRDKEDDYDFSYEPEADEDMVDAFEDFDAEEELTEEV